MPVVGLLSDSHDIAAVTRQAVAVLLDAGATRLIHLGDVGTPQVLDELVIAAPDGEQLPVHVVFGNVDWDTASLQHHAEAVGLTVDHPIGELELHDGGLLVYTHGHLRRAEGDAIAREARYFCHGHTHEQRDDRNGDTRIINPGALHRASQYTVALLDTRTDDLTFYPVAVR